MKKYYFFLISVFLGFLIVGYISAEKDLSEVTFPIPELGNCASEEECEAYCELPENMEDCLDFAEANNIFPEEEIEMARRMLEATGTIEGPGECSGQNECENYCNAPENMEECIIFAIENDLISPGELEELEMVLAAIRQGAIPPPCRGEEECDVYCSEPGHIEECVDFGVAAGFISAEEAEMIRRTGGVGPGGCRGREECDAFCEDPNNMEECINFGIQYGLMPPDEIEEAKMMLEAIKKGIKPLPCQSEEECDDYCSQPEHAEECINFALAAGFMSQEEAEMARKMAEAGLFGQGPGGCEGEEECKAYCDNPDNMVECIEFSVKAGFMSEEDAEHAKKMAELGITGGPGGCEGEEECNAYCDDPNNMDECIQFSVKAGFMTPEEAEQSRKGGPGGCRSEEECMAFCDDPNNSEECIIFSVEQGFMTPEQGQRELEQLEMMRSGEMPSGEEMFFGPGGCQGEEECKMYCSDPSHFEECGIFPQESTPPPQEEFHEEFEEFREEHEEFIPPEELEEFISPEEFIPPSEETMPLPGEIPPTMPSTEEVPQSFFDRARSFLANVAAAVFGF